MGDEFSDLLDQGGGPEPTGELERSSYSWAEDVYWVYEHLGDRVNRSTAGNAGRYALWKNAKADVDKFITQMMPRAMSLLEKSLDKEVDDAVIIRREKKNIAELENILADALVEANLHG